MTRPGVGLAVPPDARFLALLDDTLRSGDVDSIEVAPETTWAGAVPGPFGHALRRLCDDTGLPVAAHSIGFSPGSHAPDHHARWLARMRADHAAHPFLWWTEHRQESPRSQSRH